MGKKRVSTRTNEHGERVSHHPDGSTYLHLSPDTQRGVCAGLESVREHDCRCRERHAEAVCGKQAAMDARTPVPHDKRPF